MIWVTVRLRLALLTSTLCWTAVCGCRSEPPAHRYPWLRDTVCGCVLRSELYWTTLHYSSYSQNLEMENTKRHFAKMCTCMRMQIKGAFQAWSCWGIITWLVGLRASGFVCGATEKAGRTRVAVLGLGAPPTETAYLTVCAIHHFNELSHSTWTKTKGHAYSSYTTLTQKMLYGNTYFNMNNRSGFLSSRLG